jgi:3,4-dihydroxy-9,10-secoandrosta-1,3,5(10)-triene-9,17-dione 4,5-dioxygenase
VTDSPIAGLGYVVVGTQHMDEWCDYATNVLGLMPSKLPLPDGSYAFRMDDRMARIILHPGNDAVITVGWEVRGRPQWYDLLARLNKAGVEADHLVGDEPKQRGVNELLRVTDPSGDMIEFGFQPLSDAIDRFVSPTGVHFVTGDQAMGHVTRAVANYPETVEFYTEVLGFSVRDTIDLALRATFMSPNPRQHSLALVDGHGESRFHHVMMEVDSIDDVGRCFDRVQDGAAKLRTTIGRHFNDLMISFYMESPSGMEIEYGYGGRRINEDESIVETTEGGVGGPSLWGHRNISV